MGSAVTMSATRGGDIVIRASGGTAVLSMTLAVTEGTYRPYFELVSPPQPAIMAGTLSAPPKPAIGAPGTPQQSSQPASIVRIVRLRASTPWIPGVSGVPVIPLLVTVRNAYGAVVTRGFVVTLTP